MLKAAITGAAIALVSPQAMADSPYTCSDHAPTCFDRRTIECENGACKVYGITKSGSSFGFAINCRKFEFVVCNDQGCTEFAPYETMSIPDQICTQNGGYTK